MPNTVKSLVASCQDILTKHLDVVSEVGCVPYSLMKNSLVHATPQQLYKIEKANPDIAAESDELWLKHCLTYKDIREDYYEHGLYRDPSKWRELYLNRYKETEKKRQLIKQKVKSQYSKIQNEKEKRSIKVLHGVVPTTGKRSYEAARRSTMSKLFQQTRKETEKVASIYQQKRPTVTSAMPMSFHHPPSSTVIKVPKPASQLTRAYQSYQSKYPRLNSPPPPAPLIAPRPHIQDERHPKRPKLDVDDARRPGEKKKKPVAMLS
ncbi:hypothetical protein MUCCIDRAFT_161980 [Mucor lusitanicus CBS 277.49]|uniref:Elongin-A n=1 Tax=Mucor lusitanicus CBS 277.49 TaxID=747725 RepID=A0A162MTM7_MUCCL|nr:hypothetical protein MUCCIDRAFT_161980 [Mucor lusitanicus CBS 277.49]